MKDFCMISALSFIPFVFNGQGQGRGAEVYMNVTEYTYSQVVGL